MNTTTNKRPKVPEVVQHLLEPAGIVVNGSQPWDIQVYEEEVFTRTLSDGTLGFGGTYMQGMWDCDQLDEFFTRCLKQGLQAKLTREGNWHLHVLDFLNKARHRFFNLQKKDRAFEVGERHYDTGNDVFERMLDPTMCYSCGYWEHATTLEQAQLDKLDLVCRKLQLKSGEKLLDIGCGWGSMAHYAAQNYGVEVTGITVSKEQKALAEERCKGLPVEIILEDYRDLEGQFDKVVSIGMFEHVGPLNYDEYFNVVRKLMKPEGLFLLHTIGTHKVVSDTDPWTDKYIFPNGQLPSAAAITEALGSDLLIRDWDNFGQYYDPTLMAWWENFDAHWDELKDKYSGQFYRMWRYYLHSCAGMFRAGRGQLWQIVLSRLGEQINYRSIR